ncbi:hypothetical protein IAU60_002381 [Kwoniella sp. DSM 27419]
MAKNTDPTMGGLDALVAAASSVAGHAGKNRAARGVGNEHIDPALQDANGSSDVADAMSLFLTNPAVVQLIAEYNARKQHRHVSLYTQLLSGSTLPYTTPDTPVQQTRSGRISRPPAHPLSNQLQQLLAGVAGSPAPAPLPSSASMSGDTQMQAIKDALENVTVPNDTDVGHYDALMQVVGADPNGASRFWRNADLNPAWGGIEATTLAQAAETSQRPLGHGLPPSTDRPVSARDGGKRSVSLMDSAGEESTDSPDGKRLRGESTEGLPEWPLPPTGKGGRKNMPRDELLARRRARNRVAAQESRKKKKEFFGSIAERLQDRDASYELLKAHCQQLEQEVEALRKVVLGAGLDLPTVAPTSTGPAGGLIPDLGLSDTLPATNVDMSFDMPANLDTSFQDLFTIDDNDADDGDFVPPSSPKRDSESDDSDAEDDGDVGPTPTTGDPASSSKNKKGRGRRPTKEDAEETPMAEDVEEDLFLPIEDVPVPPRDEEDQHQVMKQAMTELHVDTPQEMMGVIKKMVETAGYGGVTEEQVGMLSKLLAIGQAQGMSVW